MDLKTQLFLTMGNSSPAEKARKFFETLSARDAMYWYSRAKYQRLTFERECTQLDICPFTFKKLCADVYRERSDEYNS